jgi:hypothetical protein
MGTLRFAHPTLAQAEINRNSCIMKLNIFLLSTIAAVFVMRASAAEEKHAEIPDFFFQGTSSAQYCVARVDLLDGSFLNRRSRVIGYIRDAYTRSAGWQSDYSVGGIDYINYLYFHLAGSTSCKLLERKMDSVRDFFRICEGNKDNGCIGIGLRFSLDPNSQLTRKLDGPVAPIALFESIRGRGDLQKCTIKITGDMPNDIHALLALRSKIDVVVLKYRMSILDIHEVNNNLYILLSKQCSSKEKLFNIMLELFDGEGFDWRRYLRSWDLSPDVSEYRYSEMGRQ